MLCQQAGVTGSVRPWMLRFEFHMIIVSPEILFLLFFFKPFKNIQTILNSWVIQK